MWNSIYFYLFEVARCYLFIVLVEIFVKKVIYKRGHKNLIKTSINLMMVSVKYDQFYTSILLYTGTKVFGENVIFKEKQFYPQQKQINIVVSQQKISLATFFASWQLWKKTEIPFWNNWHDLYLKEIIFLFVFKGKKVSAFQVSLHFCFDFSWEMFGIVLIEIFYRFIQD